MNINDYCGIAVLVSLVLAVALFVALIIKINFPPRHATEKQPAVDMLRTRHLLTRADSRRRSCA